MLWLVGIALSLALAALGWLYAAAHPRHRAVAAFVTVQLAADVLRRGLAILNAPAYAAAHGAPLAGWARINFHLDEALELTWPLGLAALACVVFLEPRQRRRAAGMAGVLWALAALALALAYPAVRRDVLGRCYLVAHLAGLTAVIASGWAWWQREVWPTLTEGSVIMLGAVELGAVLHWSPFGGHGGWDWQATMYFAGYAALTFLHAGESWKLSAQPR